MGLEGKKSERLQERSKNAKGETAIIRDLTRQEHLERKRQHNVGLGPNIKESNPCLVEQYQKLLGSEHSWPLARLATSQEPIILKDSSDLPGRPLEYDLDTHTIYVPLKAENGSDRPLEDVREDLHWELYNTCSRNAMERIEKIKPPDLSPTSSPEEKETYLYKMAAYALANEWDEWRNTIDHDLRVQAINADPNMGKGGPHVARTLQKYFAEVDQGWYQFTHYIKKQIKEKHTAFYDPNAANPNWVGEHILAVAQEKYPASLMITQRQVRDWQIGKTTKVKSPSNNPFVTSKIIKQAHTRDRQII